MPGVSADVRSAVRSLLGARGFTSVALLTLGTGLTLCLTALTVINAYLIRPLPYPAASRLYNVGLAAPGQDAPRGLSSLDWSLLDDVVEHHIAWDLDMFYLLGGAYPEPTPGAWVTPGFLQGLGLRAAIGRALDASDFQRGRPLTVLISDRLWESRFGRDPGAIGRVFTAYVSDRPDEPEAFTIVGVLPAGFWHLNPYTDVLAPLRAPAFPYMVRLREGVAPEIAVERMTALVRSIGQPIPEDWRARLTSTHARYVAEARPIILAVAVASGLVLLIACANVAVLLLVRGTGRRHEIAIRLALGASQAQIARLLALEAIVLGGSATVVGLAMSALVTRQLGPILEQQLGRRVPGGIAALALDQTVVIGAILFGLATTVVCALAPLTATWRTQLSRPLAVSGRSVTDGRRTRQARSVLIAVEVAASLTLLTGSSLMIASTLRMLQVDFGFRAAEVLSFSVGLRQRSYPDPATRTAFYQRLLDRVAEASGNQSVALGEWWPSQGRRPSQVEAEGTGTATMEADVIAVSANYFATLGIALRDGDLFSAMQDRLGGERVVVLSETLARRLWPGARAVGQRLRVSAATTDIDVPAAAYRVVGVVNDVRDTHADEDHGDAYVPLLQRPGRSAFLYVRAEIPADAGSDLRGVVARLDPEAAVGIPRTLDTVLNRERVRSRTLAWLLSAFAACAGALALVGVCGVIAYSVRQRQREIGIRMAVGADRGSVTRLFVREGGTLLLWGLTVGLLGAVAIGRLLRSQLFGIEPAEPHVLAATTIAFATGGLLAIWWPARRAAGIDPACVLKEE